MTIKIKDIPYDVPGIWLKYVKYFTSKGVERPIITIHGGYGKKNMGDDAILHVIISRIRKHLRNARIIVICHGPENILPWYTDIEAFNFKSLGALKAIINSDLYIVGGGGIINRINAYSGFQTLKIFDMKGKFLFLAAQLAKMCGAKTHFYAIGATSFPDNVVKILSRVVLSYADDVSVRDPLSINNLKSIGVKRNLVLVGDPALSLEPAKPEEAISILNAYGLKQKGVRSRPLVAINCRYVKDPEIDNNNSVNEVTRLVDYLSKEKKCDTLFLPISRHPDKKMEDDVDFGYQVKKRLKGASHFYILKDYYRPQVMMALMGQMDFMILARLHSVILGTIMDIPIFTISYDNKVAQFIKLIEKEDRLIQLSEFSLQKVRSRIDSMMNLGHDQK